MGQRRSGPASGEEIYRFCRVLVLATVARPQQTAQGTVYEVARGETGTMAEAYRHTYTFSWRRSGRLEVSRSEERLRGQLGEVLTVLVLGLPLVVVAAGVGGYVLARRSLTPMNIWRSEPTAHYRRTSHEGAYPCRTSATGDWPAGPPSSTRRSDTASSRPSSSFALHGRRIARASHALSVIRDIGESGNSEKTRTQRIPGGMGSMLEEGDRLTNS